jgi:hypothetical protein
MHLPERLSRLGERGRGAVSGLAGDLPEENAGHSGKLTGRIGGLDGRDRDSERPEDLTDSDFAPQVGPSASFRNATGPSRRTRKTWLPAKAGTSVASVTGEPVSLAARRQASAGDSFLVMGLLSGT